jgi:hypothetical protein
MDELCNITRPADITDDFVEDRHILVGCDGSCRFIVVAGSCLKDVEDNF